MSYDNENKQSIVNQGDNNTSYQGSQEVRGDHSVSLQGSGNVVTIQSGNGRKIDVDYTKLERGSVNAPILYAGSILSFLLGALAVWADYITISDAISHKGWQWTFSALWSWAWTIPNTQTKIPMVAAPLPLFRQINIALFWHLVLIVAALLAALALVSMAQRLAARRFVIFRKNNVLVKINGIICWMKLTFKCDQCEDPMNLSRRKGRPWLQCPYNYEHSIPFDETGWVNKMRDMFRAQGIT